MLNEEALQFFRGTGRKGGLKTLQEKGRNHFVLMGKKSGEKRRKKLSTPKVEEPIDKGIVS